MTLDDGMSIAIIFVFLIGFILIFVLIITIFKDSACHWNTTKLKKLTGNLKYLKKFI